MNEILSDLIQVVNSIPEFYFSVPKVSVKDNKLIVDEEIKLYERRFVAQLKSEYDKIIREDNKNYEDVNTDFEIIKKYIYTNPDERVVRGYKKMLRHFDDYKVNDEIMTIPDFFIHKAQDNFDEEFQKLIVEAKTADNLSFEDFCLDLFKLNVYVEKFNYQNAVFVIGNNLLSKIEGYLTQYNDLDFYKSFKRPPRIHLFVKENYNSEIKILTFIPTLKNYR